MCPTRNTHSQKGKPMIMRRVPGKTVRGPALQQALGLYPRTHRRVPHIPDFLCSFVGSLNFMRLSLKKGAHVVMSRAAYRKFGASRSFFARCGIPQAFPSSLLRSPQLRTGAPCSHQRTWAENDGRSPPKPFVPNARSSQSSFTPAPEPSPLHE
jgi:hypothetical protein